MQNDAEALQERTAYNFHSETAKDKFKFTPFSKTQLITLKLTDSDAEFEKTPLGEAKIDVHSILVDFTGNKRRLFTCMTSCYV